MALQVQMHLLWTLGLAMSIETAHSVKQRRKCCNLKVWSVCILPHDSYLVNLASCNQSCFTQSYTAIMDELIAGRLGGMQSPCSAQGAEYSMYMHNTYCTLLWGPL